MSTHLITFEQPVNEYIRVCLRLERLFSTTQANIAFNNVWECRNALLSLLEVLNVIDRPDLKSKLSKALSQHASVLSQLEKKPEVDKQKLQLILRDLDDLIDSLYRTKDRMCQELRNNVFLSTIRQHMSSPGGACPFNTPAFHLWLHNSPEQRQQQLAQWFNHFEKLQKAVKLLLELTRTNGRPEQLNAESGFYHQALNPATPCHLVRITVDPQDQIYPEISVGKHRLSVRFYKLNTEDRSEQTDKDIEFELRCCGLS